MRLPQLKYNAAELASLTVLLAIGAILAAVLLARSCNNKPPAASVSATSAADSIAAAIDSTVNVIRGPLPSSKKTKSKTKSTKPADRQPVSRDYLDEPVNE